MKKIRCALFLPNVGLLRLFLSLYLELSLSSGCSFLSLYYAALLLTARPWSAGPRSTDSTLFAAAVDDRSGCGSGGGALEEQVDTEGLVEDYKLSRRVHE